MNKSKLKSFIDSRASQFLEHFAASEEKYTAIWDIYSERMPGCVRSCRARKCRYGSNTGFEGPQGIHWIGKHPKIMFLGRENYGWYESKTWGTGKESICFAPLEFTFFTAESMGGYWAKIRSIAVDVLELGDSNWEGILKNIAVSNGSKCYSDSGAYLRWMHLACIQQRYVEDEIRIVRAPMNVLFSKSVGIAKSLFAGNASIEFQDTDFLVLKLGDQILIECAHPVRKSDEWLEQLKTKIMTYL